MGAKADKPEGYEPAHTLQEVPPCCRTFAKGRQLLQFNPTSDGGRHFDCVFRAKGAT